MRCRLLAIFLVCALMGLVACASSGGGSDDDNSGNDSPSGDDGGAVTDSGPGQAFSSRCGAVIDNVLVNPVPSVNLEEVSVEVLRYDILRITRLTGIEAGNMQLVKLHGIESESLRTFQQNKAEEILRQMTANGAFLAKASTASPVPDPETGVVPDTCSRTFPGGGEGTVGQLFTRDGQNIAEMLLAEGAAVPVSELCNSQLLLACYQSIEPEEEFSPETIRDFLWKPVAERDGNLVVLVDPVGITVVVQGAVTETLVDFGPSNGRGSTARGSRPGGGYGGNIRVTFFDSEGRQVLLNDGRPEVIIPNGSDRVEFILP